MKAVLIGAALLGLSILAIAQPPSQYDASPPYPDGSVSVGQYALTGSARSTSRGILLTSAPHQTGAMWHSTPLMFSSWQVMIKFYVTGSSSEGDHGWAFWFAERPGQLGEVFGNAQNFNGFALIFDSKDNDGHRNNPSVAAHLYDGTKAFNHADDGVADQLSGCVADYRNRNEPVTARITYKRPGKLDIYLDLSNRGRFQRCMSLENIQMPYSYFVGITAQTEEKDDNHVIESIKVTDMTDSNDPPPPPQAHRSTPPAQQQQQPPQQQYTPPAQQHTPPPPAPPPQQQYTPPPPPPPAQQQYTPPPATQQQHYQPAAATASLSGVSEDAIRKAVSAALLEQLQSTQNQIADRVRGLVADSARELRDNTDRWASKHSDLLQKEVIPLLQSKAASGGSGGSGADFSEVMKLLREREDKIDNSVRTLSESLVSVRDILARPASGSGNVRSELEPIIRQQEQIARDLAGLKKDLASLTQLSSISQNVDRVHRGLGSLEVAVSQGIGSIAAGSGGSYIVYGLLAAILAAVIYVIVQNKNESRYGKLI